MDYYPEPQLMNNFTKILVKAFDQMGKIRTNTGFQSLFGRTENGSLLQFIMDGSVTEIEVRRGTKKAAKLKPRGEFTGLDLDEKALFTDKSTVIARGFPWVEETTSFNKVDIDKQRMFGQNPYQRMSFTEKMRQLYFERMKAIIDRIIRLNEILAAQVLIEGKMVAQSDTTDESLIYDMYRNSDNEITCSPLWSVTADAVPWANLDTACDRVAYNGEGNADVAIFGMTSWTEMQATDDFKAKADLRRVEYLRQGETSPSKYKWLEAMGFTYQMTVRTPKGRILHLFTYDAVYTNDSDVTTYYMGLEKVLVMDTRSRQDKFYGPKATLDDTRSDREMYLEYFGIDISRTSKSPSVQGNGFDFRSLFFDAIRNQGKTAIFGRAQQSPLFVLTEPDCTAVLST
jgi:hypothetical protein